MQLNHLVISGNLTRDPELRTVGADKSVASFAIAHNIRYKTQDGEQRDEVTFVECDAWGRQGEMVAQYLQKGSLVVLEGSIRQDNWTDKEGQKRSRLKLRVDRVHFTPRHREGQAGEPAAENGTEPAARTPAKARADEPRPSARSAPARQAGGSARSSGAEMGGATVVMDDPPF